jgi:hypothetical protein
MAIPQFRYSRHQAKRAHHRLRILKPDLPVLLSNREFVELNPVPPFASLTGPVVAPLA